MWSEFKKFAFRGNVMDLAVGVMIGAAFNSIVSSVVNGIFMPVFGLIFNTKNLDNLFVILKDNGVEGVSGMTAAEATAAGATVLSYGQLISAVINFFLIALIIFFMVKLINKLKDSTAKKQKNELAAAPAPRLCPYCKGEVHQDAVKCPHCTSSLTE